MRKHRMRLCLVALSATVLLLSSHCAAAEPAEVTATTYFKSPYTDLSEYFKIEEAEIGPVKVKMPLPDSYTLTLKKDGEGQSESYVMKYLESGVPRLLMVFNANYIAKDNGKLFDEMRKYHFKLFATHEKGNNIAYQVSGGVLSCHPESEPTFEYNVENGYFFHTMIRCGREKPDFLYNVVDGAIYVNNYSMHFTIVHYDEDNEFVKSFAASWLDSLLKNNK